VDSHQQCCSESETREHRYGLALHHVTVIAAKYVHVTFLCTIPLIEYAPGLSVIYWFQSVNDLPIAQRLMSGPSSMPSGQAQVYLGEWSVIWGAFRQRYSQPPLGRLPMLQVSGAGGTQADIKRGLQMVKYRFYIIP